MRTMRRIIIFIGLIFVMILIIGCIQKQNGSTAEDIFLIKYTQDFFYKGEHRIRTIIIFPTGESNLADREGIPIKIPDSELKEFINFVVKDKNFFSLPADLTGKGCNQGASTEYLEVKLEGVYHKIGGYCVLDNNFREIYSRLTDLISANTPPTPGE